MSRKLSLKTRHIWSLPLNPEAPPDDFPDGLFSGSQRNLLIHTSRLLLSLYATNSLNYGIFKVAPCAVRFPSAGKRSSCETNQVVVVSFHSVVCFFFICPFVGRRCSSQLVFSEKLSYSPLVCPSLLATRTCGFVGSTSTWTPSLRATQPTTDFFARFWRFIPNFKSRYIHWDP